MDEKSTRQGRPGPEPLNAERDLYRQLMAQGMGNSQACREIGINRRTGTRWRYGRTVDAQDGRQPHHYPPITPLRPVVISARYLSAEERDTIADLRRAGRTMSSIATELGRSAGTISREFARNSGPEDGEYRPQRAQRMAEARRPRARPGRLSCELPNCLARFDRQNNATYRGRRQARVIPIGDGLGQVIAEMIGHIKAFYTAGAVPACNRRDNVARTWLPPAPYLLQGIGHPSVISAQSIRARLQDLSLAAGARHADGSELLLNPHDCRRVFATEHLNNNTRSMRSPRSWVTHR